jgi:pantoate--beta-alanine ligase
LFVPTEAQLYPQGRDTITRVEVPGLSGLLEGASRPGHFTGVTTVVNKLFNIVQPDVAVFGEKDFQQLLLIRHMVEDLNIPVHILGLPTRREADGLAMSSRNTRLTPVQRELAPLLYHSLQQIRSELQAGKQDFALLRQAAQQQLEKAGFVPDYIELRDARTLAETRPGKGESVILAAARLGDVRLIDNLRV